MAKNFFWWSYQDKYEKRHECSRYNEHEVGMVVSLCSWLVCNKVASSSIAVLTPYRGQVYMHLVYCSLANTIVFLHHIHSLKELKNLLKILL